MRPTLRVAAVIAALSVAAAARADGPPEPADPVDPAEPGVTTPAPAAAPASPEGALVRVLLRGGQELRGRLVPGSDGGVVLELPGGGRVPVAAELVERIDPAPAAAVVNGELWEEDRNRTRYLYAPSAFMLRRGEGYFSQKELFFSSVGFGVTDHVTLLVGAVLPAWFVQDGFNVIGAVKVGGPVTGWLHLAAGAETFVLPAFGGGGFAFAAATVGGPTAHLTVAAGPPFAFSFAGRGASGDPIVVLSGSVRVARTLALVTESWLLPVGSVGGDPPMLNALALRFLGDRGAVDVGFVRVPGGAAPVPWLDFTWNFGER